MLRSRMLEFSVFCAVVLVFTIAPAQGEYTYWQHEPGTPGDWFDPSNWDNGVPTDIDTALIDNGGTAVIAGGDGQSEQLRLGSSDTGSVLQSGGTNTISNCMYLGKESGSQGTYELSEGQLTASDEKVGYGGMGTFTQTGGLNTIGWILDIGYESGSQGTYELSGDGQIMSWIERIGWSGTGTFLQSGGTNTISYNLRLGSWSGSQGTYEISGGVLETSDFYIGWNGSGILNITSADADITVSGLLNFGPNGSLAAVPGSTIHMTGSVFENESTSPAALAGLGNLKLIFEGGSGVIDPFEAAAEDMGAVTEGFVEGNFLLDTLQLGGTAAGKIELVDDFDNQSDGATGNEAVYVNNLIMNAGATINLNGLNLYYDSTDPKQFFCGDATLDGFVGQADLDTVLGDWGENVPPADPRADLSGDLFVGQDDLDMVLGDWGESTGSIPEPASATVLLLGTITMLKRRKKT